MNQWHTIFVAEAEGNSSSFLPIMHETIKALDSNATIESITLPEIYQNATFAQLLSVRSAFSPA